MNRKQLLQIIGEIDNQISQLTLNKIDELSHGDGLYSILEKAIDSVITNKEDNELFWKTYQSTTHDGTPKENYIDFMIIEEYFEAKMNAQYSKLYRQEVAKQIQNMKRDIIMNISDDNRWLDYILDIQEYLPEIPEEL